MQNDNITLKASRFVVSQDENYDYKVFVRNKGEFKDVTDSLTQEETKELISDLIYAISDLLKAGVDNAG